MTKLQATKKLGKIFDAWVKSEYFPVDIQNLCIHDLPFAFREELTTDQKKFLDSLLFLHDFINTSNIEGAN
tara:strand:- start:233 stop:445 length:213 start_codon:yes stop_codon:yes gene_type:complete